MAAARARSDLRVELHRTTRAAHASVRAISDALGAAGVRVDEDAGGGGPALLVATAIDAEVLGTARLLSRAAGERLLLVLPDVAALAREPVWDVLRAGVADVLAWHGDAAPIVARLERWRAVDALARSPLVTDNIAGSSPAFRAALRQAVEIGRFTDASVLVTGESGTGKELVARLIHALDPARSRRELVIVDCTTIVPALAGSELFGHERGAYTGAVSSRDGAFALADGGTLFLDEVGELPPSLQAELLRAVQERTYKPVGSNRWRRADFRLVAATNRDLLAEEARGAFRRDLYFRIAQWRLHLPPLAARPEDILPLARRFLADMSGGSPAPDLDPAVRAFLLARDYPGNVRDLRQLVARLHAAHVGPGPITAGEVPPADRPPTPGGDDDGDGAGDGRDPLERAAEEAVAAGVSLKELTSRVRAAAIRAALEQSGGSVPRSARRLGVTDRALQMQVRKARDLGTPLASESGDDHAPSAPRHGSASNP